VVLAKTEIQRKQTMNIPSIDQVKEFWDSRPCNIRHSDKVIGTKEYFDDVENKKLFVEPNIISFSEFSKWQDKSVLEIGCGMGTAAINFVRSGADYTGVELSDESLKLAKQRFNVYGYNGTFYSVNAEELSTVVPAKKYDLVYSWGVIHHSPNPGKIVNEAKNYLKDDGVLKIMVYAKNSWKNCMIEAGLDQPEAQFGCPIAYTYTHDEIISLLGDDMEVVELTQDHIFPYQIEPYKINEFIKQPWFESMPDHMFKVLEKNLGWHLMITAKFKDNK
jgi:2-polyprenyl-3-methyl-5-hydroxy-6-metoxy-1,4-benzoquinol methylase